MRHPNEATLALHAGGDLGPVRRWLTTRHLTSCAQCREEVASFDEMRELLPNLAEIPEIAWSRMAAEIQANVRLGLAAGECVRAEEPLRSPVPFIGWRSAVALGTLVVLVAGGLVLEQRPWPLAAPVRSASTQVRSTSDGPEWQAGEQQRFGLTNGGAENATNTWNAQGSMGTRYKDPVTGQITIATVSLNVP